ncbi:MAG: NAD(+)/NADH kinase [Ruminococcaceae bacterium]|nr:NAD(+)/NADH kinase [Oscillospiraceae bacterium]
MKKIILTPNPYRDKNFGAVRAARDILQNFGFEVKVCLPFELERTSDLPRDIRFHRLDRELPGAFMVVCFGGDGTILHMAKAATRQGVPILGVNMGTLGFMAELENSELSMLGKLATGEYTIDERMMLDVTVYRDRDIIFHDISLNDVVVTKGAVARVVHLNVRCDDIQAMECNGDGVIIATPTGSTAYNLSAGGPVVEPEAANILITPICAHDMVSRSIVASDKRVISVELMPNTRRSAYLSVDGGKALRVNAGDIATVKRSLLTTKLVRIKERSFYDVINQKFRNS